jgi:hypothetical protein
MLGALAASTEGAPAFLGTCALAVPIGVALAAAAGVAGDCGEVSLAPQCALKPAAINAADLVKVVTRWHCTARRAAPKFD